MNLKRSLELWRCLLLIGAIGVLPMTGILWCVTAADCSKTPLAGDFEGF